MKKILTLCGLVLGLAAFIAGPVSAKLPAPSPEAKAKAAEAAAKTAWAGKVDGYQLCQVQDRVAAKYRADAAAAGKQVPAAPTTPACTDPGPFAYAPPAEQKPIEASGAHSPADTASAPPSTNQPASTTTTAPKQ